MLQFDPALQISLCFVHCFTSNNAKVQKKTLGSKHGNEVE